MKVCAICNQSRVNWAVFWLTREMLDRMVGRGAEVPTLCSLTCLRGWLASTFPPLVFRRDDPVIPHPTGSDAASLFVAFDAGADVIAKMMRNALPNK